MHGVLKVKTTEEQEQARKEEKERQLKIFRAATNTIFENRTNQKYTTGILSSIADVLIKAPDWYTLWNYRREIIIHFRSLLNTESGLTTDEYAHLLSCDLDLTRHCLMENPKSYASWHHRCWVMQNIPEPNWKAEIQLCNLALSKDERNFHCWDYRRFVVRKAGITAAEEFEFTDKKLADNFSNFSSWHYRSTIFENENEQENDNRSINSIDVLTTELETIHEAVYTDPSDQSPWFYHRWLLGRTSQKMYLREIYINRKLGRLIIVFAKPESRHSLRAMEVDMFTVDDSGNDLCLFHQSSCSKDSEANLPKTFASLEWMCPIDGDVSAIWWASLPLELIADSKKVELVLKPDPSVDVVWTCRVEPSATDSVVRVTLAPHRMFNSLAVLDNIKIMDSEIQIVRDLYEMENGNKWVLLTLLSLFRLTTPLDSMDETRQIIDKLKEVDPLRQNFYSDLYSRYSFENAVIEMYHNGLRSLELPFLNLTRLYCLEWLPLITYLNLESNQLKTLPEEFTYLMCLETCELGNNEIDDLKSLRYLPSLTVLNIQNNKLASFSGLEPVLNCPRLTHLDISGNSVVNLPDFTNLIAAHPKSKSHFHSISILYEKNI